MPVGWEGTVVCDLEGFGVEAERGVEAEEGFVREGFVLDIVVKGIRVGV